MLPGVVFCTSVSVSTFVAHSSAPACRLEKSEHLDPRKGDKSPDWTHTHTQRFQGPCLSIVLLLQVTFFHIQVCSCS